jgi:hypothetical protein
MVAVDGGPSHLFIILCQVMLVQDSTSSAAHSEIIARLTEKANKFALLFTGQMAACRECDPMATFASMLRTIPNILHLLTRTVLSFVLLLLYFTIIEFWVYSVIFHVRYQNETPTCANKAPCAAYQYLKLVTMTYSIALCSFQMERGLETACLLLDASAQTFVRSIRTWTILRTVNSLFPSVVHCRRHDLLE